MEFCIAVRARSKTVKMMHRGSEMWRTPFKRGIDRSDGRDFVEFWAVFGGMQDSGGAAVVPPSLACVRMPTSTVG
jgi:hypothetical protein